MLHVVSVLGVNALKKVDFFLQDLRLCVDHTYDTCLITSREREQESNVLITVCYRWQITVNSCLGRVLNRSFEAAILHNQISYVELNDLDT